MKRYAFRACYFRLEVTRKMTPEAITALDAVKYGRVYEFPDDYPLDELEICDVLEELYIAEHPTERYCEGEIVRV